jgi:hypothetical protein
LVKFGVPGARSTPRYPFWHLRTSGLWEVHGVDGSPSDKHAEDRGVKAGFTPEAAALLKDPEIRAEAVAILRTEHLHAVDEIDELLERVCLAGYDTASGSLDDVSAEPAASGPVPRNQTTVSRLNRDSALAAQVKRLHENRCQVCGTRLPVGPGPDDFYSEAAHIRGLGSPHHGPDELPNMLCLCPNHHKQFDGLTIYIDADRVVRSVRDSSWAWPLRLHPDHRIKEEHLSYHRRLCNRDV